MPIAIGATAVAIAGGAYGIVSATAGTASGTATTAASPAALSGRPVPGGGGSNARSGPAAGGAIGTVDSVSASSFTISTAAGQKVTVKKASSTTYRKGTNSLSASAVKKGLSVLVLGTTDGTTITASQVIVQPTNGAGSATSSTVVPFQRGAPSTSKQVGQIPANYTQGSGTIVGGTAANKATAAALAAYPGGVVDRVVKLSNGEYEVHNIGVNWPHHIFVNQAFKVVGAN
jgi:membrane-bound inhibitor of C-type lysozyme